MARNRWDYVIAGGYILTGAGLLGRLLSSGSIAPTFDESLKGPEEAARSMPPGDPRRRGGLLDFPGHTKATLRDIGPIEARAKVIARLIKKGGLDPKIHEAAKRILAQKCASDGTPLDPGSVGDWCVAPKDYKGEVEWLFNAVINPQMSQVAVRYTLDMLRADTFSSAERTLITHGEDCDGQAIFLGAMLESVGHPVRMKIIQQKGAKTWSHIYLQTGLPPREPTEWISLDPTVPEKPCGWEAPAEMVQRFKIFDIK